MRVMSCLMRMMSFSTNPIRSSSRSIRPVTSTLKLVNRASVVSLKAVNRSPTASKRSFIASNLRL